MGAAYGNQNGLSSVNSLPHQGQRAYRRRVDSLDDRGDDRRQSPLVTDRRDRRTLPSANTPLRNSRPRPQSSPTTISAARTRSTSISPRRPPTPGRSTPMIPPGRHERRISLFSSGPLATQTLDLQLPPTDRSAAARLDLDRARRPDPLDRSIKDDPARLQLRRQLRDHQRQRAEAASVKCCQHLRRRHAFVRLWQRLDHPPVYTIPLAKVISPDNLIPISGDAFLANPSIGRASGRMSPGSAELGTDQLGLVGGIHRRSRHRAHQHGAGAEQLRSQFESVPAGAKLLDVLNNIQA